ncbi:four helix bundle protein [Limihaloglobus sulfuriphilus]|uniref:Four helix bundle protein n=1 Tax=Limihaloglobus sulfuriphilus TaxID=1851148 RepID=A0A1Q2MEG0_9BACT|nr:four helix bundle protein [Limihaloglobus sulfuriphilus]AQQ70642.1 four helix bundle protein [Limihaloglobus sulfuriphilus]
MREPAKTFQELIVWQKAHGFVIEVYKATETYPKAELFALTQQSEEIAKLISSYHKALAANS